VAGKRLFVKNYEIKEERKLKNEEEKDVKDFNTKRM